MWRLWTLSKAYGARPSDLLGIGDDGLAAFHIDSAVHTFGTELDEALRQAVEPQKQGRKVKPLSPAQQHARTMEVLERWLGISGLKKYRDPLAGRGKR